MSDATPFHIELLQANAGIAAGSYMILIKRTLRMRRWWIKKSLAVFTEEKKEECYNNIRWLNQILMEELNIVPPTEEGVLSFDSKPRNEENNPQNQ